MKIPVTVSVIIPALNEAAHLAATIHAVQVESPHEILVVDGGSNDDTRNIALSSGAMLIDSKPGRAQQMNAGAAQATGHVLLFLHADTLLTDQWLQAVWTILDQPGVAAGAFGFRVAEDFPGRGVVEWATNLRSRWLQRPYGDQALFLPRLLFTELGGFADLPIMEDYELNQRLRRRGRVAIAPAMAVTSARRWKNLGVVRTTVVNQIMIAAYLFGVSPNKLATFYRSQHSGSPNPKTRQTSRRHLFKNASS